MSATTIERTETGVIVYRTREGELMIPKSLRLDASIETFEVEAQKALDLRGKLGVLFPLRYLRAMYSPDSLAKPDKWGMIEGLMTRRIDKLALFELENNW